jgi:hypothetical protein
MQPVVDKVAKRLPPWKGRMLNRSGCLVLARSTLCAILVHIFMATKITPWAIHAIEKLVLGSFGADLRWPWEGNVQWLG